MCKKYCNYKLDKLLLNFSAELPPKDKPGRCPRLAPDHTGYCVAQCINDHSCPGEQKCCGGCPKKCVNPLQIGIPSNK